MGYSKRKKIIESRYVVEKKLGKGMYATTYKVKDIRTSNTYVLKLYDKLEIEQFYKVFTPESMEKAVSINFMQITDILDFGVHQGKIFFVREAFSDTSLEKIKFENITLSQFYSILGQILSAISFLDSQNFNASNLKISNLLYKFKSKDIIHVKLTDYFYIGDEDRFKLKDSFFYRAPETISEKRVNLVSNFYSLGIILYKIVTGLFPYSFEDIKSFIENRSLKVVKSPSLINPKVPGKLSDFILKLIKLNPEDRFLSMEEVVENLNKIQPKDFSYIIKTDLKSYVNYHDYYVNQEIAHTLKDHISKITSNNTDNIIVLHGQKGIRKDRTISLFRYHILNERNLIFDYHCSEENIDPFYSICVEFTDAGLIDAREWKKAEPEISKRFMTFYLKRKKVKEVTEDDKNKFLADSQIITKFMMFVAKKDRPLIFVIRNAEYLQQESIDFLNYLINYQERGFRFSTSPIMIVLSTKNVNKFLSLDETSTTFIHSKTMDIEQTRQYIFQLLKNNYPPDNFLAKIWYYTHGNPWFIKIILLQLIRKNIIFEENEKIIFKKIIEIKIPKEILNNINYRLGNIEKKYIKYLEKLCWLGVKFDLEMFSTIISKDDTDFFEIMLLNDFLEKVGDNHYKIIPDFLYVVLKERLSQEEKSELSHKYLLYVNKKKIFLPLSVILSHLDYEKDYYTKNDILSHYSKRIIKDNNFYLYIKSIFTHFVIAMKSKISKEEVDFLAKRLVLNYEYVYYDDLIDEINKYFRKIKKNYFYKNIILGLDYYKRNKYSESMKQYYYAQKYAKTLEEKFLVQLFAFNIFTKMENFTVNQTKKILGYAVEQNLLKKAVINKIKGEFYRYYNLKLIRRKILQYLDKQKDNNALVILDMTVENFVPQNHLEEFVYMDFYNFYGIIESNKRNTQQAIKRYTQALKIAEKYKILYNEILLKNNLADTYLFMGAPSSAFPLLRDNLILCKSDLCLNVVIQSLVNIGEAFIKMGEFEDALVVLNDAAKKSNSLENKPFINNILHNISLIKIKIKRFNYYLQHISDYFPYLQKGKIISVNPTEKTYFYFLNQIGDYDEIERLINNNKNVLEKDQEFFYRAKSFLTMHKLKSGEKNEKLTKEAFEILQKAKESSRNIKSKYAETITLINLSEYYLILGELTKAEETIDFAIENSEKYEYHYWKHQAILVKIMIKLQDPKIDLKKILDDLFENNKYFVKNSIFYSEILSLYLAVLIIYSMKKTFVAKKYFRLYLSKINSAIEGLDNKKKSLFIKKFPDKFSDLIKNSNVKIAKREKKNLNEIIIELLSILNKKNKFSREIKFIQIIRDYIFLKHFAIYKTYNGFDTKIYVSHLFDEDYLKDNKIKQTILDSLEKSKIRIKTFNNLQFIFVPIEIKVKKIGIMIIYEEKEKAILTKTELNNLKIISTHIAAYFDYEEKYIEVQEREKNVNILLKTFEESMDSKSFETLERKILEKISILLDAERAFIFKDGKETSRYILNYDEVKEHTNIHLNLIDSIPEKDIFYEYFDDESRFGMKNSIFILKLYYPEFNYNATYYFDNFGKDKPLNVLKKYFINMLLNVVASLMGIVHKNMISTFLTKQINDFREEKLFFLKLLNHEFNTPLTKILYALNSLENGSSSSALQILKNSYKRIAYLMNMINKYYYYKETFKPKPEFYNIENIISEVIKDFEVKIKKSGRNLKFIKEISKNIPEELFIDKQAIIDILNILISNSVRFSFDNSKIIVGARMAMFENERISKDTLVLYVTDFGKGISPSESKKIYNMIYEARDINSHKSGKFDYDSGGLGLGLSIALNILQKLGGTIEHESEVNKKTTFYVRIPLSGKDN